MQLTPCHARDLGKCHFFGQVTDLLQSFRLDLQSETLLLINIKELLLSSNGIKISHKRRRKRRRRRRREFASAQFTSGQESQRSSPVGAPLLALMDNLPPVLTGDVGCIYKGRTVLHTGNCNANVNTPL